MNYRGRGCFFFFPAGPSPYSPLRGSPAGAAARSSTADLATPRRSLGGAAWHARVPQANPVPNPYADALGEIAATDRQRSLPEPQTFAQGGSSACTEILTGFVAYDRRRSLPEPGSSLLGGPSPCAEILKGLAAFNHRRSLPEPGSPAQAGPGPCAESLGGLAAAKRQQLLLHPRLAAQGNRGGADSFPPRASPRRLLPAAPVTCGTSSGLSSGSAGERPTPEEAAAASGLAPLHADVAARLQDGAAGEAAGEGAGLASGEAAVGGPAQRRATVEMSSAVAAPAAERAPTAERQHGLDRQAGSFALPRLSLRGPGAACKAADAASGPFAPMQKLAVQAMVRAPVSLDLSSGPAECQRAIQVGVTMQAASGQCSEEVATSSVCTPGIAGGAGSATGGAGAHEADGWRKAAHPAELSGPEAPTQPRGFADPARPNRAVEPLQLGGFTNPAQPAGSGVRAPGSAADSDGAASGQAFSNPGSNAGLSPLARGGALQTLRSLVRSRQLQALSASAPSAEAQSSRWMGGAAAAPQGSLETAACDADVTNGTASGSGPPPGTALNPILGPPPSRLPRPGSAAARVFTPRASGPPCAPPK